MKSHPVKQYMRELCPIINTLLGFFRMSLTMEKEVLWLHKIFTETTATIHKAGIPKALQIGFPPPECVTPIR